MGMEDTPTVCPLISAPRIDYTCRLYMYYGQSSNYQTEFGLPFRRALPLLGPVSILICGGLRLTGLSSCAVKGFYEFTRRPHEAVVI
jgi:hypothetical protein